jgi:hypothetical protein
MTDPTPTPSRPNPFAQFWALVASEPVGAQVMVQASVSLVCAFGLSLNAGELVAINVFTAAVLGFFLRRSVTPLANAPTVQP